jgi:hypothetical protein
MTARWNDSPICAQGRSGNSQEIAKLLKNELGGNHSPLAKIDQYRDSIFEKLLLPFRVALIAATRSWPANQVSVDRTPPR